MVDEAKGTRRGLSLLVSCRVCGVLHRPDRAVAVRAVCTDCLAAAWHEAGHAVACVLLYPLGSLASASIDRHEAHRSCGRMRPLAALGLYELHSPRGVESWTRRAVRVFGTLCYAGAAGELAGRPPAARVHDPGLPLLWDRSELDRSRLARFAEELGLSRPIGTWHSPSWRYARRLIRVRREAVAEVAGELCTHVSIPGRRVETLTRRRGAGADSGAPNPGPGGDC
jgi:hypothetical protein